MSNNSEHAPTPFFVYAVDVHAVMTCGCHADNTPMLIGSTTAEVTCPTCLRAYRILEVRYDLAISPGVQVKVGRRETLMESKPSPRLIHEVGRG